ncbi:hypothetical protein [Fulvivirga sediminis]|uniref:Lipoprotein n=1 Tax=Fulvivirga sediminis TaxID=2803949 RepID=A0A937F7J4_9BACT|nr:hypothetical protein [Fulvivirga sediminis]MBL3655729.1 hypothetical protein [Fulvivirga sediminis]
MKKVYLFSSLLIISFLILNCSSGKKALEQGDYYQAVLKAVNRLRQKPDHKKSKETLRAGYPLAIRTIEQDVQNTLSGNSKYKYKSVLQKYQLINNMYEEIRRSPGALKIIHSPKNYYNELPKIQEMAAEESYREGLNALEKDTREGAKQAYYNFRDVQSFVAGYKDVENKIEEALFKATLKVVVEQIPVPTRYNLSARFFQDKIEEYLHTHYRSNLFVRFYNPQEAERENLPYVDQYLRLQFDDFTVGETHIFKNTETFSKDSVKVGTAKLDDGSSVDVFNTVKAKMTTWKKEVISKGLFSMQVYDAHTNAILVHNKFNGEFVWVSKWGSYNGDERALTEDQIKICNNEEVIPPPPQDLFIEFTRPIYDQLVSSVNTYYNRF